MCVGLSPKAIRGGCGWTIYMEQCLWLIPQIGVGAFFMALLLGQMALSFLMEGHGWMGAMKRKITPVQFVGIALMIIGVAMIRL